MEKLEKENSDFLRILIQSTHNVDKHNQNLATLEENNQKDSDEYKTELKSLINAIKFEDSLYNDSYLTMEECFILISLLLKEANFESPFLRDEEILFDNDYNRVYKRILIRLNHIVSFNYEFYIQSLFPEPIEEIELDGFLISKKDYINGLRNGKELPLAIINDIIGTVLYLYESYKKEEKFNYLKSSIIKLKYNTAFLNRAVEKCLIKDNFTIKDVKYDDLEKIVTSLNVPDEMFQYFKDMQCLRIVTDQIDKLLVMDDTEYKLIGNSMVILIRTLLMRACFILMTDEAIEQANQYFHSKIIDPTYFIEHGNDYRSEGAITKAFMRITIDRENNQARQLVKRTND